MPAKAANMAKKRAAADEAPSQRPKRARTAAPPDTKETVTKTTAAKKPTALKKPAAAKKSTAAKKATKAAKPVKDENAAKTAKKPAQKPALTNGEAASKKRVSPDATESQAKRVKSDGAPPKKAIAKPKGPAKKVAAKSPVEIIKKLPTINSAPTQKMMVFACGEGSAGELGLGPKKSVDVKRPRLNPLLDAKTVGVVQVATGGMHCVALTYDNKILTWGVNDQSALGRNTDWDGGLRDMDAKSVSSDDSDDSDTGLNPKESTPGAIADDAFPAGTKFVQVAAGDSCSFALTDTGLVYGWGTFRVS
jgi:regulator of chromosome condensation